MSQSKEEYLKRYLSGSDAADKKKKKKKKTKANSTTKNIRIFDDDVDLKSMSASDPSKTLEDELPDEEPTVAEFVDERPEEIVKLETYRQSDRWKQLGANSNKKKSRHDSSDSDGSPMRRMRHDSNSDSSPIRGSRQRHDSDSDQSPLRKQNRHDSDSDQSPPRKQNRHDSDSDQSPPRKQTRRHDSDSDQSPPRRQNRRQNSSDSDQSPPRRRKTVKSDQNSDSDQSPPRKTKRTSDSDQSPPRRRNNKKSRNDSDLDLSPVRQSSRKSDFDKPSQKRRANRHKEDSDVSPPRRNKGRVDSDSDKSPPRRKSRSAGSRWSERSRSPEGQSSRSRGKSEEDREDERDEKGRRVKTLGGVKAGLSSGRDVRKEMDEKKRKEDEMFRKLDADTLGKNAKTVFRDKSGRRRNMNAEAKEEEEERKKKEKAQAEIQAKYNKWSKGMAQQRTQDLQVEDALHEASKPLARFKDDDDLDEMLKKQDRDEDPMLAYMKKKKAKTQGKTKDIPRYSGPQPPANRYNIWPGYRWDGVDRSNGFEKKIFMEKSNKKALENMKYKWSVEDM